MCAGSPLVESVRLVADPTGSVALMCYDHEMHLLDELFTEEQLQRIFNPIRCLPPLGIHENCEHFRPEPSFKNLDTSAWKS